MVNRPVPDGRPVGNISRQLVEGGMAADQHKFDEQGPGAVLDFGAVDGIEHVLVGHGRPAEFGAPVVEVRGIIIFAVFIKTTGRPGPQGSRHHADGAIAGPVEVFGQRPYAGGQQ